MVKNINKFSWCNGIFAEGVTETDLYVKPTDSHQYLLSSGNLFYCKKGIPYSQAQRLKRICSNNEFFWQKMQWLREYLLERGYIKKMVQGKQNKTNFNITYHPVFWDVRKILEELHLVFASDDGHKKVFPDLCMIGFKINKNWNAHLVRSQLPDLDEVGRSKVPGGKRPCHLCENIKEICTFKSKHLNRCT